jgi:hypothetical protein
MGSVQEYKICKCGNPEMSSDYFYKSEELYESCEVCGYWHSVRITNKPDNGKYPENWKPEYEEKEETTGYVLKVKGFGVGYEVGFVQEKDLEAIISALEIDERVQYFGITFKRKSGFYATQIFKYGTTQADKN